MLGSVRECKLPSCQFLQLLCSRFRSMESMQVFLYARARHHKEADGVHRPMLSLCSSYISYKCGSLGFIGGVTYPVVIEQNLHSVNRSPCK